MARMVSCSRCGKPSRMTPCGACRQATGYMTPAYIAARLAIKKAAANWYGAGGIYLCAICGLAIETLDQLTTEHMVPLREGGSDRPDNLYPAHHRCNSGMQPVAAPLRYRRPG